MTVRAWPSLGVSSFRWSRVSKAAVFSSIFGSQALNGAAPVWEVQLSGVPQYWPDAIAAQTFIESLDGFTHQVELWNLVQPVPAGTMRGTITLRDPVVQGAMFIIAAGGAGQAGRTLKAGDLLGIGSGLTQQVLRVASDAVADASGNAYVNVNSPVRNAFAAGVSVVWDRPKALFRQKTLGEGIDFQAVIGQPWSLSFVEDWRL
jgi:hypothetical protein